MIETKMGEITLKGSKAELIADLAVIVRGIKETIMENGKETEESVKQEINEAVKIGLMNELTKIRNVMSKVIPDAPHEVMLVLDGSTGQNAFEQAKQFTQATKVTSLAITKLDGTAKGGVVIGISDRFHVPVRYIGIGEGIDQLRVFDRREFVKALFGE